jgi:hypothetical protein
MTTSVADWLGEIMRVAAQAALASNTGAAPNPPVVIATVASPVLCRNRLRSTFALAILAHSLLRRRALKGAPAALF